MPNVICQKCGDQTEVSDAGLAAGATCLGCGGSYACSDVDAPEERQRASIGTGVIIGGLLASFVLCAGVFAAMLGRQGKLTSTDRANQVSPQPGELKNGRSMGEGLPKEKRIRLLEVLLLAETANQKGDYTEAILQANDALTIDPNCIEAYGARGLAYYSLSIMTDPHDLVTQQKALWDLKRGINSEKARKNYEEMERSFKKLKILQGIQ